MLKGKWINIDVWNSGKYYDLVSVSEIFPFTPVSACHIMLLTILAKVNKRFVVGGIGVQGAFELEIKKTVDGVKSSKDDDSSVTWEIGFWYVLVEQCNSLNRFIEQCKPRNILMLWIYFILAKSKFNREPMPFIYPYHPGPLYRYCGNYRIAPVTVTHP